MPTPIPPPGQQLPTLLEGIVDLNTREELAARLAASHSNQRPLLIKAGFDPTAPDIHLGHTVVMEKMAGRPVDEVNELRVSSGPIFQIVREAGAATSGSDARRKIEQGGVRIGGERVDEPSQVLAPGRYELEVGKKFKARLVVEPSESEAGKA